MSDAALAWVDDLQASYVWCRGYGHVWNAETARCRRLSYGLLAVELTCHRCTMRRLDVIDSGSGHLVDRSYIAPDGYAKPRRVGEVPQERVTADELRARSIGLRKDRRAQAQLGEEWAATIDRAESKA